MLPKIYASSAPPWESGGSTVEKFESGLVKVSQEYLCPTDQRDAIIASSFAVGSELTGVASPASDGLYIFPSPHGQDLNNGFSKISVTAYGRIAGEASLELTYRRITVPIGIATLVFFAPNYRVSWVMKQGDLPIPGFLASLKYKDAIYLVDSTSEGDVLKIYTDNLRAMTYTTSPASGFGQMQEQIYNVEIEPVTQA